MPAAGGTPRQVSKRTGVTDIAWHPDGASIYFLAVDAADRRRTRAAAASRRHRRARRNRPRHLWKMAVADGPETRVTSGDRLHLRLQDRGQTASASSSAAGRPGCRPTPTGWSCGTSPPMARAPMQLTKNAIPEEDGELAPDGSQVLFIARANHRQEPYYNANLFLVPATGGQVRALMPDFRTKCSARAGPPTASRSG